MKLLDAKASIYIDFDVESFDKDPKFKVSDLLEITIQQHLWKRFKIKLAKDVPWTYVTEGLHEE